MLQISCDRRLCDSFIDNFPYSYEATGHIQFLLILRAALLTHHSQNHRLNSLPKHPALPLTIPRNILLIPSPPSPEKT